MRLCFVLLLLGCASAAAGYEVDERVVVIHDAAVKLDDQIIGKVTLGETLKIEAVEGDQLKIFGSISGWIGAGNVIAQSQAMAHFDQRIAANPQDSDALRARGQLWY